MRISSAGLFDGSWARGGVSPASTLLITREDGVFTDFKSGTPLDASVELVTDGVLLCRTWRIWVRRSFASSGTGLLSAAESSLVGVGARG